MSATPPRIAVISGGLGGARIAIAVKELGLDGSTFFVTNVGDDLTVDGLLVCPDTDAVLYALAGLFDEERGWGIRGDEFPTARAVRATGRPADPARDPSTGVGASLGAAPDTQHGAPPEHWFSLGERDYAHHARRRALLDSGLSLAAATARLAADLGVVARVSPATDDAVRTRVVTEDGVLAWQEWLVRDRAAPVPTAVEFGGADTAEAHHEALAALSEADLVLIAPSSPVASVAPILAIPGYADVLRDRLRRVAPSGGAVSAPGTRTVAVTPVAVRRPLESERDRCRAHARAALLLTLGLDHTPAAVAGLYAGMIDAFVIDPADAEDAESVAAGAGPGTAVTVAPGPTTTVEGITALLRALLE